MADGFGLQVPCAMVGLSSMVTALYSFARLPETNPNALAASVASKSSWSHQAQKKSEMTASDTRSSFSAAGAMLRDPRLLAAGVANASTFALRQGGRANPHCTCLQCFEFQNHVHPAVRTHTHMPCCALGRKCFGGSSCYECAWVVSDNLGIGVLRLCLGRPLAHLSSGVASRSCKRLAGGGRAGALCASSSTRRDVFHGKRVNTSCVSSL